MPFQGIVKLMTVLFGFFSLPILDMIFDINDTRTWYANCHIYYGSVSVGIIASSYFVTVVYVYVQHNEGFKHSVLYPFYIRWLYKYQWNYFPILNSCLSILHLQFKEGKAVFYQTKKLLERRRFSWRDAFQSDPGKWNWIHGDDFRVSVAALLEVLHYSGIWIASCTLRKSYFLVQSFHVHQ